MLKLFFACVFFSIISCGQQTTVYQSNNRNYPPPVGSVNDFEGIFTAEQRELLTSKIEQHEKQTTNKIAIVTVADYAPDTSAFQYSFGLARSWGVGAKGKNNGLLMMISQKQQEIFIQTGTGLEDILRDEICKRIITRCIIPEIQQHGIFSGINRGLDSVMYILNS